jgi:uncharacterized protein YbcI
MALRDTQDPAHDPVAGSIIAEISREIVGIHAKYYGRGPTKAKAIWRHGIVVVVLEEIFTKPEEMLVSAGQFLQVRAHRQAFQDQVEPLFCKAVEKATGRPVRGFLSQVTDGGIASEVFVLADGEDAGEPESADRD